MRALPAPPRAPAVYSVPPPPSLAPSRNTSRALYALVAVAAMLTAAYLLLMNRDGGLVVTVSGPGGRALDEIEVHVDGQKRCGESPCRIEGLSPGPHLVRAGAKGYQTTADQAVAIEAGKHNTHNITLESPKLGTGIHASAKGSGLKLYVDGQEMGALPQTLKDMEPGDHVIRIAGSPRYEPWEKRVQVQRDQMLTLGPVDLKVIKGLATIKAGPGADDARVLLDGRLIPSLPATIEVPADETHELVARKEGFSPYRRQIRFDDGVAEKTFEITMVEGSTEEPASSRAGPVVAAVSRRAGRPAVAAIAPAKPAPSKGKATLNMNSIPVSNVILNGRPLGPTPKIGVQVEPGSQTVVFVHPEHGRKVMSGAVAAGEAKTFMAKFP